MKDKVRGYVYFITRENDRTSIKIGFTSHKDVNIRIRQLQTSSVEKLILLYSIKADITFETYLHHYFNDYRICGEWFGYDIVNLYIQNYKLTRVEQLKEGIIED